MEVAFQILIIFFGTAMNRHMCSAFHVDELVLFFMWSFKIDIILCVSFLLLNIYVTFFETFERSGWEDRLIGAAASRTRPCFCTRLC